ncbi:hypothetical protein GUJ93_ZPchr0004g39479 [Zizania palustris]|uniref:Beta-glucosidase n=1 Tax=Zizania palustris TaxID=103762 RepID=A0A8J5RZ41_ZIZPA|nr:hypothetical protein GUJ93_ZPchr0004g39479 [Zizania palustris]
MAAAGSVVASGGLVLSFLLLAVTSGTYSGAGEPPISRRSFPEGFIFGTASSSYQVKASTSLPFSYNKIVDRSNGDVAADSYHLYKEDVRIMKDMGMDAYRFSISWTRILPRVQPFATLFHWDSPQALEDKYNGFLSPNIINDYKDYAEICFKEFGDRVKHWITFNEPWTFCSGGYASGTFAPGFRNGLPIGPQAASPWLFIYPQGFRELLLYVKENYGNPTIYITENGVDELNNKTLPLQEALKDDIRIEYYHKHLLSLLSAIRDGANVKGYFAWSLLDNFEWVNGYTVRFGINFVDYNDGNKRYPKNSAHWFKKFLQK